MRGGVQRACLWRRANGSVRTFPTRFFRAALVACFVCGSAPAAISHLTRGWRFITELRARPGLADIPVVVMTGAGQRTLASAPVSAGYLAKPLDRERLLETIEAALARTKRRKSGSHPIGE